MDAPIITHRPSEMTEDEREASVAWLATLRLAELRRRQDIIRAQQPLAFAKRDDVAMADLNEMELQTAAAVDRQTFGTEAP